MDFDLTDDQQALRGLAERIFGDLASTDRVAEVEATDDRFDRNLWEALAEAGLIGVALPERDGGLGLGMVEACLVLEQQGRRVAPVPLLAVTALGAWAISAHGSEAQRSRWLEGITEGSRILTGAWTDPAGADLSQPLTGVAEGTGWRVSGTKVAVPAAGVAEAVVVPVDTDGHRVAIVPTDAEGLTITLAETTSREVRGALEFDAVRVEPEDLLEGDGDRITQGVLDRARIGICAMVLGCCEEALAMAATHVSEREQFGRPLSTNQGVAIQAADAAIDTDGIRVTLQKAAWRLDNGLDLSQAVPTAKWWAAEAGQRVVVTTQHLHGGTGADISHPAHRYFLWVLQLADSLGGAGAHLARLGSTILDRAS
ncbi:MAG: acyl-CoA/acyl-ACP dehydrogenase [Actinobacteria bacterium]|nr:acyl-CoA/acyl-ACP dehydrogenase [Actinomycetota bacterium]